MSLDDIPPASDQPPFFLGDIAARKSGVPGWQWFHSEVVGPDFMLEGGVPRKLKTGKRKGQVTWKGQPTTRVVVTRAELIAEMQAYETTTGKCRECAGAKRVCRSVSVNDDKTVTRTYGDCRRCKGTGSPPP